MLGNLREKILSWGAKILLGLLIVSFALWGIGDYTTGNVSKEEAVVTIGEREISSRELESQVETSIARMRQFLGQDLTNQQAFSLGIVDQTLKGMVQETLLSEGASDAGLIITDETVGRSIRGDRQFQNRDGIFDRNIFNQALNRSGLNESTYAELYREELLQNQLLSPFEYGIIVPTTLSDSIFRHRKQQRIVKLVKIKHTQLGQIPNPPQSVIKKFHTDNASEFSAPEFRSLTILKLRPEDISNEIEVPEERIKDEYESRLSEFTKEEQREIQQILVSDEQLANKVSSRLNSGSDFITVGKEVANLDRETIALGKLTKKQLPINKLADAAFSLNMGTHSIPIRSDLGWHILRINNIIPGSRKSLGEVRDELKKNIQLDLAADALIPIANQLEDELGGGATIKEAARRLGIKINQIESIDSQGLDEFGKSIDGISGNNEIIRAAFETPEGEDSTLMEYGTSNFFILHVQKVTPASLRPLNKIESQVTNSWKRKVQADQGAKEAENFVIKINSGKRLEDLAKQLNTKIILTKPFTRIGDGLEKSLPGVLITKIFNTKVNNATWAAGDGEHLIAYVSEVKTPNSTGKTSFGEQMKQQLKQGISNDLKHQLADAFRLNLEVKINDKGIKELFVDSNNQ